MHPGRIAKANAQYTYMYILIHSIYTYISQSSCLPGLDVVDLRFLKAKSGHGNHFRTMGGACILGRLWPSLARWPSNMIANVVLPSFLGQWLPRGALRFVALSSCGTFHLPARIATGRSSWPCPSPLSVLTQCGRCPWAKSVARRVWLWALAGEVEIKGMPTQMGLEMHQPTSAFDSGTPQISPPHPAPCRAPALPASLLQLAQAQARGRAEGRGTRVLQEVLGRQHLGL